ncbi:MAG: hypothetical protein AAB288_10150 [Acidobacteriota bacterium]
MPNEPTTGDVLVAVNDLKGNVHALTGNMQTLSEKVYDLAENVQTMAEAMQDFSENVDRRFDHVDVRLDSVEARLDRVEGRIDRVESTMVTKDYLDTRLADLKGGLISINRHLDGKIDALTDTLVANRTITDGDRRRIGGFGPFPNLPS